MTVVVFFEILDDDACDWCIWISCDICRNSQCHNNTLWLQPNVTVHHLHYAHDSQPISRYQRRVSWGSKKSQTTKLFPRSVSLTNFSPNIFRWIVSLAHKIPQKCSFEYLKHIYQFCQDSLVHNATIFILLGIKWWGKVSLKSAKW